MEMAGSGFKPSKASDRSPQPQPSPGQPPKCPQCNGRSVWKDGLRYLKDGRAVQRWLCRSCGYRFSEPNVKLNVRGELSELFKPGSNLAKPPMCEGNIPLKEALDDVPLSFAEDSTVHNVTSYGKSLNKLRSKFSNAEYCGGEGPPKNSASKAMALAEEKALSEKRAAGATETSKSQTADIKSKLVEFAWWMKKRGYAESTITSRVKILKTLLKRGADLYDPESVKDTIARQEGWSNGRKELAVEAYSSFLLMLGLTWEPPRYKRIEKLPFIPLESEIDQFIAGCSATKRLMVFLQLLKETGMRCGEALRLKWTDIDFVAGMVRVQPEKGGDPRAIKISSKLIAMLNTLPKTFERVFPVSYDAIRKSFDRQRKRLSMKLQNPRPLQISFHTFRHFKATMEYAKTKDILHVMRLLGHKNIKNTLIYTQLVDFKVDEYVSKVARNAEEACQLVEAGFEYVCTTPENLMIFKKRK